MSVEIITDSTSYIPREIIEKYKIKVASLTVSFSDESFKEVDVENAVFYEKMEEHKEFPISSQPSIDELYNLFERAIKKNNSVVGIFLSSKMSGTFSTANLVKNMILEKYEDASIEIIDSKSNCMQLGYSVIAAAKEAMNNDNIKEVIFAARKIMKRSRFIFTPDTLDYLKKGGRIGGASALFGNILQIKPVLTVQDGTTSVLKKVRTKKRAINSIIEKLMEDVKKCGLGEVLVHHINSIVEAKKIAREIEEKLKRHVIICDIGPVIGAHVGPGAIGIVYYTKEELVD